MSNTTMRAPAPAADGPVEPDFGFDFESFVSRLDDTDVIMDRRRDAWERYLDLDWPTTKVEEWRYTDLNAIDFDAFRLVDPDGTPGGVDVPTEIEEILDRSGDRAGVLVQTDGRTVLSELVSDWADQGVVFGPIREIARSHPELIEAHLFRSDPSTVEEKLWTLHTAFLGGGFFLHVPRDVRIDTPFHAFRWISRAGSLTSTHGVVVAETGSEVTIIDEYLSDDLDGEAVSLSGIEVHGEPGATVRYVGLQRYGRGVRHFGIQHLAAARDAKFVGFNVTLGGDLARLDVTSRLQGPGSDSEMLALWFGDSDQHFDHNTLQHHAAPHAHSDLLYKGGLADRANSVFRGLIRVDPGAQLTDAYQTNRNLLLSEEAHATTLPNLEIEADDVRCSHGATVGQVDATQIFYLMSRGLSRKAAERLLVFGFFDEVLGRLPVAGVRERVRVAIEEKIGV